MSPHTRKKVTKSFTKHAIEKRSIVIALVAILTHWLVYRLSIIIKEV